MQRDHHQHEQASEEDRRAHPSAIDRIVAIEIPRMRELNEPQVQERQVGRLMVANPKREAPIASSFSWMIKRPRSA